MSQSHLTQLHSSVAPFPRQPRGYLAREFGRSSTEGSAYSPIGVASSFHLLRPRGVRSGWDARRDDPEPSDQSPAHSEDSRQPDRRGSVPDDEPTNVWLSARPEPERKFVITESFVPSEAGLNEWYVRLRLRQEHLAKLCAQNLAPSDTVVWSSDDQAWVPVLAVPQLLEAIRETAETEAKADRPAWALAPARAPGRELEVFDRVRPPPPRPKPRPSVTPNGPKPTIVPDPEPVVIESAQEEPEVSVEDSALSQVWSERWSARLPMTVRLVWLVAGVAVTAAAVSIMVRPATAVVAPSRPQVKSPITPTTGSKATPLKVPRDRPQAAEPKPAPSSKATQSPQQNAVVSAEDLPMLSKSKERKDDDRLKRVFAGAVPVTLESAKEPASKPEARPRERAAVTRKRVQASVSKPHSDPRAFDLAGARLTLAAASSRAKSCVDGPAAVTVVVTFASSGIVGSAHIARSKGDGVRRDCVLRAFQMSRVRPFEDGPKTVQKTFRVR